MIASRLLLRMAGQMCLQNKSWLIIALFHNTAQEEERLWTELIDKYEGVDANWRADIVGRAYGNRGNARTRQGKMDAALADYNKAIAICPWSVDPVLNRCAHHFLPPLYQCNEHFFRFFGRKHASSSCAIYA